jgi:hypothetical protein
MFYLWFFLALTPSLFAAVSPAPGPETQRPSGQPSSDVVARRKEGLKQAKTKFLKMAQTPPEQAHLEKIWAGLEEYDFGSKPGAGIQFIEKLRPWVQEWLKFYPKDPEGRARVLDGARGLVFVVGEKDAQEEVQRFLKELNLAAEELMKKYPKNPKVYLAYGETLLGQEGVDDAILIRVYRDCARLPKTDPTCRRRYQALKEDYERPRCPSQKASSALHLVLAQEKQDGDFKDKVTYGPSELFRKATPALRGKDFASIGWGFSPGSGQPVFNFALTPGGAEKLATVTGDNVGKYLLVYADKDLLMGPKIMERIEGGRLQMNFGESSQPEAVRGAQNMLERLCQKIETRKLPKELTL